MVANTLNPPCSAFPKWLLLNKRLLVPEIPNLPLQLVTGTFILVTKPFPFLWEASQRFCDIYLINVPFISSSRKL